MTQHPATFEAHLGYWLRMVSNGVTHSFAARLEGQGASVPEWVALRALYAEAMPPSRLATRLDMTRGAVTKLVDRVIARGLVQRAADPGDGRGQILALTEAGRALVPELARIADENDRDFFADFSEEDRDRLRSLLLQVVERHGLAGAHPVA